jgi:tetratricopeptide (TPR) repeat protein
MTYLSTAKIKYHKKKVVKYLKTYTFETIIIIIITLFYFSFSLLISFPSYTLGNLFFGKTQNLYNLKLANFFFVNAAYPLIGKPVEYAHYQLSRTYFIQGKLNTALAEAKKELELYPENTRTYYILGLTYGYMNQEEKAIEGFSQFIETHPDTWAGRNDKAWLQFRIGDVDGALATIEPVATSTGLNNVWVQNTYGTLLMNKKRLSEAREAFSRAEKAVNTMTEMSWGSAYPGNDPRIYSTGLKATRISINNNLKLIAEKANKK